MCRLRLIYITYVENQPLVLQWFVLFYKGNVWEKYFSHIRGPLELFGDWNVSMC